MEREEAEPHHDQQRHVLPREPGAIAVLGVAGVAGQQQRLLRAGVSAPRGQDGEQQLAGVGDTVDYGMGTGDRPSLGFGGGPRGLRAAGCRGWPPGLRWRVGWPAN